MRTGPLPVVVVIGIGADGWSGLPAETRERVLGAEVLLGGARQLAMVPPCPGQERLPWPSPLREGLPEVLSSYADRSVVALASGDPLVSGIATTLIELGVEVEVIPAVSSVALARARLGWAAESCVVVSVVGRDARRVLREMAPGRRVLVLSSDSRTPAEVAGLLVAAGWGESMMTVLGDLGAATESRRTGSAVGWSGESPALNVLALEVSGNALASWVPGLPDDAFEHDGQLTKRDLRASALARLAPTPGQLLWDVGAGAGSVGIEWMRTESTCRTIAVEANAERAARIGRNAGTLGVPDLRVVAAKAPDALAELPAPDAIFVGGGASRPGVLDACVDALGPGGRLVVHAVTLETEAELVRRHNALGGELTRISVETAAPVGTFTGWSPARAVIQWSWIKP